MEDVMMLGMTLFELGDSVMLIMAGIMALVMVGVLAMVVMQDTAPPEFEAAARQFGWEAMSPPLGGSVLEGIEKGRKFRLHTEKFEGKRGRVLGYRTRIKVWFNDRRWATAKVVRMDAAEELMMVFGGKDLPTGHEAFDKAYRVTGDIDEVVMAALGSKAVYECLERLERFDELMIKKGELYLAMPENLARVGAIKEVVDEVVEVVVMLEKVSQGEEAYVEEALARESDPQESDVQESYAGEGYSEEPW